MKNPDIKINQFLLFWILLVIVLIYGRPILIPITFAALLSMLLAPLVDYLDKKGSKRIFSTIACLIILLAAIILTALILIGQITSIRDELPRIEERANELIQGFHDYVERNFDYPVDSQKEYLQNQVKSLGELSASYLSAVLKGVSGMLVQTIIMLVVTFLLLFDKEKYRSFFMQIIGGKEKGEKHEILNRITNVSQQYLFGRMVSIFILFILYFIVLLIIGIENVLLLAAVAAVVNIIPYIGPILAAVFPVIIALVTKESFEPAIWVIITFSIIQGIDNYFVTPFFMGGEVNLSALATILIIICGGYVWGIAGMILFVPLLGISKILLDHTDEFKPYGYLIADPAKERPSKWLYRWLMKK
jgi:predicted PurR-regulated permease PerM